MSSTCTALSFLNPDSQSKFYKRAQKHYRLDQEPAQLVLDIANYTTELGNGCRLAGAEVNSARIIAALT